MSQSVALVLASAAFLLATVPAHLAVLRRRCRGGASSR